MAANSTLYRQLQDFLHTRVRPRRHTIQLVALIVAFAVRPLIGNFGFGPIGFSIALVVLLLVSLYTVQVDELIGEREKLVVQKRRQRIVGWAIAIPAVAERIAISFSRDPYVPIVGMCFWLFFFAYITWHEIRSLLRHRKVTAETISLSISVYLFMGMTWTILYILIYYLQPNAFNFPNPHASELHLKQGIFPVLTYFSLVTISTVGFGDISPLSLQARYAAVAESITGQFYLAILVARLVGLYMSQNQLDQTGDQTGDS